MVLKRKGTLLKKYKSQLYGILDNSLPVCMKRLPFFNICVSPTIVAQE